MEFPVLQDNIKLESFPLYIYSRGDNSLAYISENRLSYLEENKNGNISLERFARIYENKKFSKCLEYCEEDLPHVLKTTYKYFARDRSVLPRIMDYFNSEK